jgi:hypothetical protein
MLYKKIFERCTKISGISEELVCPSVCPSLKHSTNVDDNVNHVYREDYILAFYFSTLTPKLERLAIAVIRMAPNMAK